MNAESRREVVVRLTGAVAHLYGIGSAIAGPYDWDADARAIEIDRVLEMLQGVCSRLESLPHCRTSVLEQCVALTRLAGMDLDDTTMALAVIRAGLIINTWCTAAGMLVSAQASEGPLTLSRLMRMLESMEPDARYQAAVIEKLSALAYDNSAMRQLGGCYFQAFEGYSLLELSQVIGAGDAARAADLLDNASRGALTAVRFLERRVLADEEVADEAGEGCTDGAADCASTEHADDSGADVPETEAADVGDEAPPTEVERDDGDVGTADDELSQAETTDDTDQGNTAARPE